MPIKLKNIPVAGPLDPLQRHLNTFVSIPKEKVEHAKKKLKAACTAADLLKKNTDIPGKVSQISDPLKTDDARDNLTVLSAVIDKTVQVNQETEPTIKGYLSNLDYLRKENQLVYGRKLGESNLSLGLGLLDIEDESEHPFYKKSLTSTATSVFQSEQYTQIGAVEFAVTYDSKIFIISNSEGSVANNLYKMAQGTLLKAVGCMQIANREIEESLNGQVNYISVYNAFFSAEEDNIAVSLFALQQLGMDLNATKVIVPNDNAPLVSRLSGCNISIHGEIKNAAEYLNGNRFLGLKILAKKKLTFIDKINEFFCMIDDEILVKKNKKLIKEIYGEKELLKLNLIKLFNCTEEIYIEKKDKITDKSRLYNRDLPSTSLQAVADKNAGGFGVDIEEESTGSFNEYWQAIKDNIQFFREKNIDLMFLVQEINMILAYIVQNSLTLEENNQLKQWTISEKIPGRGLDLENISDCIKFYIQDPIKTCIALLKDYTKGDGWRGAIYRFFSGAWNRNYKNPVNEFLSAYHKNELPIDINICGIYEKLKDSGLMFNSDAESKSSLRKILLFCAKLNNEEDCLLDLINNRSLTYFPPIDQNVDCCFGT